MELKDYFTDLSKMFISDEEEFKTLIKNSNLYTKEEKKLIEKALDKAKKLHGNQQRASKIPYITHPISVASFLVKNNYNAIMIIAALLHDTFEDTKYTFLECVRDFGLPVAILVDSVSKIGKNGNYETRNKILLATEENFSTGILKTGDRLHNGYTLDALPDYKQVRIAKETEGFYVPLTDILSMNIIKKYYEDICLFFLDNLEFINIYNKRNMFKEQHDSTIEEFLEYMNDKLEKQGIHPDFSLDIKNIGTIYKGNVEKKILTLDDDKDMIKVQIKVSDVESCFRALNVVNMLFPTAIYNQVDNITTPTESGYEAITTKVIYNNTYFNIEISTEDMYKCNNHGIFYSDNEKYKEHAKEKIKEFRLNLDPNEE